MAGMAKRVVCLLQKVSSVEACLLGVYNLVSATINHFTVTTRRNKRSSAPFVSALILVLHLGVIVIFITLSFEEKILRFTLRCERGSCVFAWMQESFF